MEHQAVIDRWTKALKRAETARMDVQNMAKQCDDVMQRYNACVNELAAAMADLEVAKASVKESLDAAEAKMEIPDKLEVRNADV